MNKIILAIETSCDDTSIALLNGNKIESLKTHSQIEKHSKFGGVVPELASRYHTINIFDQIQQAFAEVDFSLSEIDAIAVTQGPGLINSLQVGLVIAKTLSQALNVPLYAIDHIEAHAFSSFIGERVLTDKAIIAIASGGHTSIFNMNRLFSYKLLGETLDDAIGESFDKVGKLLGLQYPGGPQIDKVTMNREFLNSIIEAPNVAGYNMSYSGLKSKVISILNTKKSDSNLIAYSFQKAAIDHFIKKIVKAAEDMSQKTIIFGGGVTANTYLRNELAKLKYGIRLPKLAYTNDNAAMIGYLAFKKIEKNLIKNSALDIDAFSRGGIS